MKNWNEIYREYEGCFKNGVRTIGIEKEFPVVDAKTGMAFDVRRIFPELISMGGEPIFDPFFRDEILSVKYEGVEITTDAGWGTMEVPSIPTKTIQESEKNFESWMNFLKGLIEPRGGKILGYGIQPLQPLHDGNWIKKRRHQVVCQNFGCIHDKNITMTSSDQVHVSVGSDEAVRINRVMNWLAGPIIAMFANSPVWQGDVDGTRLAPREFMWWFAPKNRHGVFTKNIRTLKEYFDHMISMQHLVAWNCEDYFVPGVPFKEFVEKKGMDSFWKELPTLEGTNWANARLRAIYGTVEIRPACQQPKESAMALPAFSLGIIENLEKVESAIADMGDCMGDAEELREIAMSRGLKARFSGKSQAMRMSEICSLFLDLARDGLANRKMNEEQYLAPLYARVNSETTLAEEVISIFNKGGVPALIERLAY